MPTPSAKLQSAGPQRESGRVVDWRQSGEELWKRKWRRWTTAGAPSRGWPVTDRGGGALLLSYTPTGVTGSNWLTADKGLALPRYMHHLSDSGHQSRVLASPKEKYQGGHGQPLCQPWHLTFLRWVLLTVTGKEGSKFKTQTTEHFIKQSPPCCILKHSPQFLVFTLFSLNCWRKMRRPVPLKQYWQQVSPECPLDQMCWEFCPAPPVVSLCLGGPLLRWRPEA